MPQMANITVKAANGTTDVIYNAMTPSSGDKTRAIWRVEAASTVPAFRPLFSFETKDNGSGSARVASLRVDYPYVVEVAGVSTVKHRVPVQLSITLPKEVPDTVSVEAIAQTANLLKSALVQDSLKSGFAPN